MVGTITQTIIKQWKDSAGFLHRIVKGLFSDSYVAGGDSLNIGSEFRQIISVEEMMPEDAGGYVIQTTDTNWDDPDGTSSVLIELYQCENTSVSDGPLMEAPNGDYNTEYTYLHLIGLAA